MGKVILLMKRCEHSEKEQSLQRKIRNEHALFKYQMLSNPVRTVYDSCNKIRFYECMMEYFQYKENISREFINSSENSVYPLAELYEIYLKHEYLDVATWKGIEEVLNVFVAEQEKLGV